MTRKFLILCGCLVLSIFISKAQDTLVLNDGTLIKSKVVEIAETTLKYKKYSNLNGPIYTIDKNQVLSIHYENGEQESFKTQQQTQKQEQEHQAQYEEQKLIEVPVADNNRELIAKYNEPVIYNGKTSNKAIKSISVKMGVTQESVLSNEDIEIDIHCTMFEWNIARYGIQVVNKSDKNIYVDLGESFAIESNGEFRAFYDGSIQKAVNNGQVSGGAVNLGNVVNAFGANGAIGTLAGGVTLGGGKQSSLSKTYINQRLVSIPPKGRSYVSVYKDIVVKDKSLLSNAMLEQLTNGEEFLHLGIMNQELVTKGGVRTFREEESPYRRDYIITYSTDSNFTTLIKVKFAVFVHQVIGFDFYDESDAEKYISNYNRSMILGNDYIDK